MSIDIFQSRRDYNEPCKWWSRNETDDYESDEMIMKRVPTSIFWAKEISPEVMQDAIVGGSFRFDKTTVTIKSPDNLWGIKNDDLILYQGEKWIVDSVQKVKAKKQNSLFAADRNCSHYWYIELRK